MEKISYYFILSLFAFVFLSSCNKDDSSVPVQENPNPQDEPQDFEITLTPSLETVFIEWDNLGVGCEIFLNDELQESNVTQNKYWITALEPNSSYKIKIVGGSLTASKTFSTQDLNQESLLLRARYNTYAAPLFFHYNSNNQLINARYGTDEDDILDEIVISYSGDKPILEDLQGFSYRLKTNYYYSGNTLERVYFQYLGYEVDRYNYTFTTPDLYEIDFFDGNEFGDPAQYYYSIELTRDANNYIASYTKINDDTQEMEVKLLFGYENGNLIHVENEVTGDEWSFEYDDKNSFLTYVGNNIPMKNGPVIFYYDFPELRFIPEFIFFQPTNNLTNIYMNGVLQNSFSYQYNELDYPSKVFNNGGELQLFY